MEVFRSKSNLETTRFFFSQAKNYKLEVQKKNYKLNLRFSIFAYLGRGTIDLKCLKEEKRKIFI
jgi:hypothetical protein